jgi:hypothetical protein
VTVGGSLAGGSGDNTGWIKSSSDMGAVVIGGDIVGGSGADTGEIQSTGQLAGVRVGGSLIGGSASNHTGVIISVGALGAVSIGGDVIGGSVFSGGPSVDQAGYIQGQRIASVAIGGSLVSGANNDPTHFTLDHSGSIRAENDLGPITVKGSLVGNSTEPVIISAVGQAVLAATATIDAAIAGLTVGGRVQFANILAGYDVNGTAVNGQASIGNVKVGLDWIASNLVAGVAADNNGLFGTSGDKEIGNPETKEDLLATIAGITIGGQAFGTPADVNNADHFGFVAELVKALSLGGTALPLKAGPHTDNLSVGDTGDLTVVEV